MLGVVQFPVILMEEGNTPNESDISGEKLAATSENSMLWIIWGSNMINSYPVLYFLYKKLYLKKRIYYPLPIRLSQALAKQAWRIGVENHCGLSSGPKRARPPK